ncbi:MULTISPECIES: S24 family peptidase [unclassified Nitratiruptor]|uniref:S24 family peptidase n=1 Tax=unclassified Nitratiruptor TaxID=2624044 RepID=UPI00191649A2|nr:MULTISPECIES: S24 family peptidase [unclassified Nitratiruptor]BCD59548.1 hypothetical protein NitYY0810_C0298 [Nitratiruptor sp. YY08-10]BCD63472.1 hypothetical protein NitYY0814_C0298 [Nitratiruptor sp. YY08-14]
MLQVEEVIERIKDVLSKEIDGKRVYDKDVAAALGITPEHFSMLKKRKKLPLPEILDFCAKRKISINWLLYNQDPESLQESTQKFAYVHYFKEVNASAGGGAFNYELVAQKLYIDEEIVQMLGGRGALKHIEAIHLLGDSMEPTLKDGSILFVDRSELDVKKGGIFLLSTSMGLFVKRVRLRLDGKLEMISDNTSYPVEVVQSDEVQVIGKVIGSVERIV